MNSRGLSSKISRHFKFVYYGHMHTSDSVDKHQFVSIKVYKW